MFFFVFFFLREEKARYLLADAYVYIVNVRSGGSRGDHTHFLAPQRASSLRQYVLANILSWRISCPHSGQRSLIFE